MADKFNEPTQRFPDDLIVNPQDGLDADEVAAIGALPSGSALLVVKRGAADGSRFLLDTDLCKAGRHPNADIFLDDVTVSRKHAEFVRVGSNFQVLDQASLNGTYLNGVRIDTAALKNGDEVQIGKFKLTFYSSPADKI